MDLLELINNISTRSYLTAKDRHKDVSVDGCRKYMATELGEYWAAKRFRNLMDIDLYFSGVLNNAEALLEGKHFTDFYEKHIHNTEYDELADVLITAATWSHAIELEIKKPLTDQHAPEFLPILGAIYFADNQISCEGQKVVLQRVINLKLKYNDLRGI